MKPYIFIFLIFLFFNSCEDYSKTKTYEFIVENQMEDSRLAIIPKKKSNFWISLQDSYIAFPKTKIIIGSKIIYDDNKKATDIYKSEEIIELFDLYIDDIKQEKDFSQRKFWNFSLGTVDEAGIYTLIITENILND